MSNELRERLKDAIEGECDGLAITDAHADAILQYVLGAAALAGLTWEQGDRIMQLVHRLTTAAVCLKPTTEWVEAIDQLIHEFEQPAAPAISLPPAEPAITHGVNCPKVPHARGGGELHAFDDDTPYNVDGCTYCGRCHRSLP